MMESLQLPYWMEEATVASPSPAASYYSADNEEFQLFDNFAIAENNFLISNEQPSIFNTANISFKEDPRASAHELLLELDQQIQSEPSWYHNPKLDFVYDQLSPVSSTHSHMTAEETQLHQDTEQLLSEFNDVCSAVGVQLTPPTTPPMSPKTSVSSSPVPEMYTEYFAGSPMVFTITVDNNGQEINEDSNESMEIIEEVIRENATNLPDDLSYMSDNVSVFSAPSSDASYAPSECSDDTSSCASFMSPRSNASFISETIDEEWSPSVDKKRTLKKNAAGSKANKQAEPKREKRPYGRPLHEKKARKKEQNKNAATRYRQKKKEQLAVVLTEEEELLQITHRLQTKHDDVKREIGIMKKLMRDIYL